MIRNSCRPKTDFTKAKDEWPCECMRCGAEIRPTYDGISTKAREYGDAPQGCRPCADRELAEAFKLAESELLKLVVEANIEPLEPYKNNKTGWKCRCLNVDCPRKGKPIKVLVKVVRAGGMACRYCSQHEIHPDDAFEEMLSKGLVKPKVPYPGIDKPWLGDCTRCGSEVQPRLHDVRNGGQGACINCAPNRPLTEDEAWDRATSYRVMPNEKADFRNTYTPWPGTCMDCGAPVSPTLSNLYRGQGACSSCSAHGFDDQKPGLVYLLTRDFAPAMIKIGICEDSARNTRLAIHTRKGWTVAHTLPFKIGLHARLIEAAVKRLWFKERAWKDGRSRGELWFDGYTETVLLTDEDRKMPWTTLTTTSLWMDVLVQAEKLGFAADEITAEAQPAAKPPATSPAT